ncbi:MAG: hypothetical protein Q4D38_07085 [Planctomycetia bacterium]|nr:hypothetical protein [Planctomycetia bacterium]
MASAMVSMIHRLDLSKIAAGGVCRLLRRAAGFHVLGENTI